MWRMASRKTVEAAGVPAGRQSDRLDVRGIIPGRGPPLLRGGEDLRRGAFARFHRALLERGVFLAPSAFEAGFVSTVHGDAEVELTLAAAREAARDVAEAPVGG